MTTKRQRARHERERDVNTQLAVAESALFDSADKVSKTITRSYPEDAYQMLKTATKKYEDALNRYRRLSR